MNVNNEGNLAGIQTYGQSPIREEPMGYPGWTIGCAWVFVGCLALFSVPLSFMFGEDGGGWMRWGAPAIWACYLGLLVLWACKPWFRRTLCYELTDHSLTIVRQWPYGSIVITISEIQSVERLHAKFSSTTRYFEASPYPERLDGWIAEEPLEKGFLYMKPGIFEYQVTARNMRLYSAVTDLHRMVLITGRRMSYLISPEEPDEFIRDIRVMI